MGLRFYSIPLLILVMLALAASVFGAEAAVAQEAAPAAQEAGPYARPITYQGYLEDGNAPAIGSYDFRFALHAGAEVDQPIGMPVFVENVPVQDGHFAVQLDFGEWVWGMPYLEIAVRPGNSGGEYTTLSPRRQITSVPAALALPGFHTVQVSNTFNLIGGHALNAIAPDVLGGTISGGGGDGAPNRVFDHFGTVAGGADNRAGTDDNDPTTGMYAVVVGGEGNQAMGNRSFIGAGTLNVNQGVYAFLGAGRANSISPIAGLSFIGGGRENEMNGALSFIGGGFRNKIEGNDRSFIGGGSDNIVYDNYSVIGGGALNVAGKLNFNNEEQAYSVVGGGTNNRAEGFASVVPGGVLNVATGNFSFAAGTAATAIHDGSFVWSDNSQLGLESTTQNQFNVRASGGVRFLSGANVGVMLPAGSGSWVIVSDRNLKTNFAPVDSREMLEKVVALPVETWQYIEAEDGTRHIGPTAQDFYAAFGVGEDERHIATVDADGVALAAIQGLYAIVQEQNAAIEALRQENAQLAEQVAALQAIQQTIQGE